MGFNSGFKGLRYLPARRNFRCRHEQTNAVHATVTRVLANILQLPLSPNV